ncbi:hypothetical protein [Nocardia sp. NPDC049707]|uniref:hypothetical protein n=1 Tax=Nocardia sp. NPDC049707 TaxID=3154735 RepID=UPI00344536CD
MSYVIVIRPLRIGTACAAQYSIVTDDLSKRIAPDALWDWSSRTVQLQPAPAGRRYRTD